MTSVLRTSMLVAVMTVALAQPAQPGTIDAAVAAWELEALEWTTAATRVDTRISQFRVVEGEMPTDMLYLNELPIDIRSEVSELTARWQELFRRVPDLIDHLVERLSIERTLVAEARYQAFSHRVQQLTAQQNAFNALREGVISQTYSLKTSVADLYGSVADLWRRQYR